MKRLKILINAYACNPYKGSESQLGWNIISRLRKFHDLTVLTDQINKIDIENYFKNKKNNIKFKFIKRKRNLVLEKIWPPAYYWSYSEWQKSAYQLIKKNKNFDICHQLNMIGLREPGYLWKINIPYIYGPVGGSTYYPKEFILNSGFYLFFYSLVYNFIRFIDLKFRSRIKSALNKAKKNILSSNSDTQNNLEKYFKVKSKLFLPVASEKKIKIKKNKQKIQVNFFWGGSHIQRKSLNICLEALSKVDKKIDWRLHVTGSGVMSNKWKLLAKKLNIEKKCIFYGYLKKRNDLPKIIEKCDVHLFSSIKEDTPAIIMETMSLGLPTICFDLFGAKDLVNKNRGIKIKPSTNQKKNILNFSKAIIEIIKLKKKREMMSSNCLIFAKKYTWDKKIRVLNKYYLNMVKN